MGFPCAIMVSDKRDKIETNPGLLRGEILKSIGAQRVFVLKMGDKSETTRAHFCAIMGSPETRHRGTDPTTRCALQHAQDDSIKERGAGGEGRCGHRPLHGAWVWGTLGWRKNATPQPPLAAAPLKGSQFYNRRRLHSFPLSAVHCQLSTHYANHISCLPSKARERVISSAYSSWEPTGMP